MDGCLSPPSSRVGEPLNRTSGWTRISDGSFVSSAGHGFRCVILRSCGSVLPGFHPPPRWVDVGSLDGDVIDVCRIGRWTAMFAPLPLRLLFPHPSHFLGDSLRSLVHPSRSCEDLPGFLPRPLSLPWLVPSTWRWRRCLPFSSLLFTGGIGLGFPFGSVFHGKGRSTGIVSFDPSFGSGSHPPQGPLGLDWFPPSHTSAQRGPPRGLAHPPIRPRAKHRNQKQGRNQRTPACVGKHTGSTPPDVNQVEKRRKRASIGSLPNQK